MTTETTREIRVSSGKFVTVTANAPDLVVQAILEAYHHGYEFGYDKGHDVARFSYDKKTSVP